MRVILFGASGMVGQGVLRECLASDKVESVLSVVRSASAHRSLKLKELMVSDFTNFDAVQSQLAGHDACFYCLGVSAGGMSESDYRKITYDYTLAAATVLARVNAGLTFVYVSGQGTSDNGKGSMWARVKGDTEQSLLKLPFKAAFMFRPGAIEPMHGIVSKTKSYRVLYRVIGPVMPVLKALFPNFVTTTERVGKAMLEVASKGATQTTFENRDINRLAGV